MPTYMPTYNPETGQLATVTLHQLMYALRHMVDLRGFDYVYDVGQRNFEGDCVYVQLDAEGAPEQPSCIFGGALYFLGLPLERLATAESKDIFWILTTSDLVGVTPRLRALAQAFSTGQGAQDAGRPWGEVVQRIESEISQRIEQEDRDNG